MRLARDTWLMFMRNMRAIIRNPVWVFVGMIQQFGEGRPDLRSLSRRLTYQAIVKRASDRLADSSQ